MNELIRTEAQMRELRKKEEAAREALHALVAEDVGNAEIIGDDFRWAIIIVPMEKNETIYQALSRHEEQDNILLGTDRIQFGKDTSVRHLVDGTISGLVNIAQRLNAASISRLFGKHVR